MKLKVGDLVRVKSCYLFPELKGQLGLFVGMESDFNIYYRQSSVRDYYRVMIGNRTIKLIDNDLEVINES